MDADKVNQALSHQEHPLVPIDEQLAHRDCAASLLPQRAEPGNIFWSERILHEERPVRLHCLAELNGLIRRDALVDIVQEFHIETDLRPQLIEHLYRVIHIRRWL